MSEVPETTQQDSVGRSANWRRRLWAISALALAVALAIWMWGNGEAGQPGQASTTAQPNGSTDIANGLRLFRLGDRPAMPPLQGTTLDGRQFHLQSLRGHVVVVNVWGSWCGPCRGEAPELAKASKRTYSDGVRFVGIDTRDNSAAAKAFVRFFGITYPSVVDQHGEVLLRLTGVIPVNAVPSTIVVDRHGAIAATVVGPTDYPTLRGLVEDVLKEARGR